MGRQVTDDQIRKVQKAFDLPNANGVLKFLQQARNARVKTGGEGYDPVQNKYLVRDPETKKLRGVSSRLAKQVPGNANVLTKARSLLKHRNSYQTKKWDPAMPNAEQPKPKFFAASKLRKLQQRHPELDTMEKAAQRFVLLERQKLPEGKSGMAVNLRNNALDEKYWLWHGKRHHKLSRANLAAEEGATNANRALKAFYRKFPSKQKKPSRDSSYRTYYWNPWQPTAKQSTRRRKLRRELLAVMQRYPGELKTMDAAMQFLIREKGQFFDNGIHGWAKNHDDKNKYFHWNANRKAHVKFLKENLEAHRQLPANNWLLLGKRALQKEKHSIKKQALAGLEARRRAIDAQWTAAVKDVTSPAFKKLLVSLYSVGGHVGDRPYITGQVGNPASTASPYQQLQQQHLSNSSSTNTGKHQQQDGCLTVSSTWPDGLGRSLQLHQSVVFVMAQLRAQDRIRTPGLLAVHTTGAGKTLENLAVMLAFWNKGFVDPQSGATGPWAIFPVSVRSNQNSNNLLKLAEEATLYFPWFRSNYPGQPKGSEYPFAHGRDAARDAFRHRLQAGRRALGGDAAVGETHLLHTPKTLYNDFHRAGFLKVRGKYKYCLFLADEIQMLFNVPSGEASFVKEYNWVKELLMQQRDYANTWVFASTATPDPVAPVLRCVACRTSGFETAAAVERDAKGLVSYAYVMGDISKFARLKIQHECSDLDRSPAYLQHYATSLYDLYETHNSEALVKNWLVMNAPPKKPRQRQPPKQERFYKYDTTDPRRRWCWFRVRRRSEYLQISATGGKLYDVARNNAANAPKPSAAKTKKGKSRRNNNYNNGENNGSNANNVNNFMNEAKANVLEKLTAMAKTPYSPVIHAKRKVVLEKTRTTQYNDIFFMVSPKLLNIVNQIMDPKNAGIHFVYSPDTMSLRLIAWLLKTQYGFQQYRTGDEPSDFVQRFAFIDELKDEQKMTRYYDRTAAAASLNRNSNSSGGNSNSNNINRKTRQQKQNAQGYGPHFDTLKNVSRPTIESLLGKRSSSRGDAGPPGVLKARDGKNLKGNIVKVVLATKENYKGLDLVGLRHLHLTGAFVEFADLLQFIGRGPRFCGHRGLPMHQRVVTVHINSLVRGQDPLACARATDAIKLLPDCYVFQAALRRFTKTLGAMEKSLMRVSVDYDLFESTYNRQSGTLMKDLQSPCTMYVDGTLQPRSPKQIRMYLKRYKHLKEQASKATPGAQTSLNFLTQRLQAMGIANSS